MHTILRKQIAVLLSALLLMPLHVYAEGSETPDASGMCGENMTWELYGNELIISGTGTMTEYGTGAPWRSYANTVTSLVLKEGISSVSAYAFYNMKKIPSVTIPASCLSVGAFAFQGCTGLQSAVINCGHLGESAFIQCTGLKTVTIGKNVKASGISAFESCSGLERVNIADLKSYCSIYFGGIHASPTEYAKKIYISNAEVKNLTIPSGIKKIGDYAFMNVKGLTSVTVPSSVTEIGQYAFWGCSNITDINLPAGLRTIGAQAFNGCTALKGVSIPSSVSYIGMSAFYGVPIKSVTVTQGIIGKRAFGSCGATASVTIGGGVTYIGEEAFRGIPSICKVAYTGSKAQLKNLTVKDGNDSITPYLTPANNTGTITVSADPAGDLMPGDTIVFGSYAQDGESKTPLRWTVLGVQEDKALVLSEKVLAFDIQMESTILHMPVTWEDSDMREYLNDTFLNEAFTEDEQAKIREELIPNGDNPVFGTPGGNSTSDRIFLLSADEAETYFSADEFRAAFATPNAQSAPHAGINPTSKNAYWWLRTPSMFDYSFMYVSYEGSLRYDGAACANHIFGIRPAMWIDTEGLTVLAERSTVDQVKAFVQRLYAKCFSRAADTGGLNNWVNKLLNETSTGAAVVSGFFNSREMQNLNLSDEDYVETCYQVMMNRASDEGGKNGWVEKLRIGMSYNYVLRGFVGSKEFTNICSGYGISRGSITCSEARDQNAGITGFVSRCYSEVLGRKADKGGLNTWCSKILSAADKKQAAINMASNGFFHSAEYKNKNTTDEEYVSTLYRTFLGREADEGGFSGWMAKLESGVSRDEVMNGFAYSAEFAKIMAKYGIR